MNAYRDSWIRAVKPDGSIEYVSPRQLIAGTNHMQIIAATPAEEIGIIRFVIACSLDLEIEARHMCLWDNRFYQSEVHREEEDLSRLFPDIVRGSAPINHDRYRDESVAVCERCAIAGLVSLSSFCMIGGVGYGATVSGGSPYYLVPNLPTVSDVIHAYPRPYGDLGVPTWSLPDPSPLGKAAGLSGVLSWLTFMPRRIWLDQPGETGSCARCGLDAPLIESMMFGPGTRPPEGMSYPDPMCILKTDRPLSPFPNDGMAAYDWGFFARRAIEKNGRPEILAGFDRAIAYVIVAKQAKLREIQRLTVDLTK